MTKPVERADDSPEEGREPSRRIILKGSALLLAGAMTGRLGAAQAAPAPVGAPAPPLPWKWTALDPMEAGTRAYWAYLKQKG
jgi:hypothetical protein